MILNTEMSVLPPAFCHCDGIHMAAGREGGPAFYFFFYSEEVSRISLFLFLSDNKKFSPSFTA